VKGDTSAPWLVEVFMPELDDVSIAVRFILLLFMIAHVFRAIDIFHSL
jgi:hypothetical protein